MTRMNTVHPATYISVKRWMTKQPDREALKRRTDVLQADAVQELLDRHFAAGLMPNRPVALVDIAQAAIKDRAKHKATLIADFSLKIVPFYRPLT